MCGIIGIWKSRDKELLKSMQTAIIHRGPDGSGTKINGDFAFGHNRLSIIDIEAGSQPIFNENGKICLIFNGEIYNYKHLKSNLGAHTFKTSTDSEVILHLYEEEGMEFVKKMDGMFALAICDESGLYLARDPLGIKPLYYGFGDEGEFYFSSEIKSLLKATKKIKEFPAGHYFKSGIGFRRYFNINEKYNFVSNVDDICKSTIILLEESVRKRLMSDVPLGVFLSGGLDSSTISAIANKQSSGCLHSFAVGVKESKDLELSCRISKSIGTRHHTFDYCLKDIKKILPKVIYYLESYDPALVRSAIPTFFVSELASNYVKVVLTGEGADELYGGYHYLKNIYKTHDYGGLHKELVHITRNLHNTNLQRADRITMANSIEGRVPFLDINLVNSAFRISPKLKLYKEKGSKEFVEKWILRRIAENYLPKEFVWRKKEKFAVGSGTSEILEDYADSVISEKELLKNIYSGLNIKSKEELLYYKYFKTFYGSVDFSNIMGKSRSLNPGQIYN